MPRKRKNREYLKPRLHIFCEGEKTEPNYFSNYIEQQFPGIRLCPVVKTEKTTPIQLVEEAIRYKNDQPGIDIFWVVYDREAVNKYSGQRHARARGKAEANGINIAFSNICFEVWLLLHFQKTVAPYTSFHDLLKKSNLKKHVPNYDKGEKRLYTLEEIGYARKNAPQLNEATIKGADSSWSQPHEWNPYTDVYKLLNAIDNLAGKEG